MQTKTDREQDGLKGAVRSVQVEIACISKKENGWIISPRKLELVTIYDCKGKRIGESFHVPVYQYSNEGIHKYDSNGNIIEFFQYFEGVLQSKMFYTYDDYDKVIEEKAYSPKGDLYHKTFYKYDVQGKVIEMIMYNADDTVRDKHTYTNEFDLTGNLTKVIVRRWTNIDGDLIYEPLCEIYYGITYF